MGALLSATAAPAAADRSCSGAIGAVTVDDDLRVPQGATCRLDRTRVEGNVRVSRGATLVARGVRVDGDVQAEGHREVDLRDSVVDGNVQLEQGGGAVVYRNRTDDIQLDANGRRLVVHANTVDGDVQLMSNRGGVDVSANRIDGNLQCKSNQPAPTGGANVVRGDAEDQCRALTGGSASAPPGSGGSGGTGRFCDTGGHAHERAIDRLAAAGIAAGGTDGCYRPDAAVTRGQMATFLQRAEGLAPGSRAGFCDTRGHAHEPAIAAVARAGIAQGTTTGCYRPDAAVTRGQMATFLVRALGL